jgi:hypothetical protein
LGIALGGPTQLLVQNNNRVFGILKSLSVGIFLYIAIGEIILEEFVVSKHKFVKFAALLVGVGFVYVMTQLEPAHAH